MLVLLALLTWGASTFVNHMSRGWFEKDVSMRSLLAVNGARRALIVPWRAGQHASIQDVLEDIARDQRIMATAACTTDFRPIASTPEYPATLACETIRDRLPTAGLPEGGWSQVLSLGDGDVHLSAIPIVDNGDALGFILLVHDLAFVERREAMTREFSVVAFGVLGLLASCLTIVIARASWRSWTDELQRAVRGGPQRPEFSPLLRDIRDLVANMTAEMESGELQGGWTAARLKQTLKRHLHGEKVVIVANREPYIHSRRDDGTIVVLHPASGLVTALEPVMRACSGTWVAHGSGSADRETADEHGRVRVPPGEETYVTRRVWLSPEEEKGYYYGYSNEGLWPLCHVAHTRPTFRGEDFEQYQRVNRKFSEGALAEVDAEDAIVLVQDYHFALAPRMIRERLPRATIISFWHIPWPSAERLGICPQHVEILKGMLGSSILGFHTQLHCNNFLDAIDRYLEARIDREQLAVVYQGRWTLVRPYPISIEWPSRWAASAPSIAECRASVITELGLRDDVLLGLGVDRMDYTKGIEERLLAVERLLEREPRLRGRFTFVQLGAPSRTAIERYRDLNTQIDRQAARINARFGEAGYRPVIIHRGHHEPPTVFRYYRAADVCYVSSLHDGMNLVAKEFVAARDDERGVLVLSHFTGAARELTEALIVNPYDLDQASSALAAAITMSAEEQQERMRALRGFVSEWNVYRWAGRMLVDAARLRQGERLMGRMADRAGSTAVLLADRVASRWPVIQPMTTWKPDGPRGAQVHTDEIEPERRVPGSSSPPG